MSVRKKFTELLYDEMAQCDRINLVVGDLGWKHFDQLRLTYPDRFIRKAVRTTYSILVFIL